MASSQFTSIPVIDIGKFIHGTGTPEENKFIVLAIREAASIVGFFAITGHGVSQDLIDSTYAQLRSFFALPLSEKMNCHTSRTGGLRGYVGMYEQGNYGYDSTDSRLNSTDSDADQKSKMDAKELFTVGPEPQPGVQKHYYHPTLFSPNIWPAHDPNFKKVVWEYYQAVSALSKRMFQLLALALELPENFFAPHITEPMDSMNMLYYPSQKKAELSPGQLGINGHTDYECFTLLSQGNVSGLQVWNGDSWVNVPALPNAFVVNISDMMARWSNDLFKSTVHRAWNHATEDRYSIAFFCACDYDTELKSLLHNSPAKYPPIIAGDHLLERINRANAPNLQKKESQ